MKDIDIAADNDFIVVTTATVDTLFNTSADALTLYIFYIKTSKWQKTNKIFSTNTYGMKVLGWGSKRYSEAKKVLEDTGLIEISPKRDKNGKIAGWYIKINYLFKQETISEIHQNTPNPLLVSTTSGFQKTDALSNNTRDALSNNIRDTVDSEDKALTDLPGKFGKSYLDRLIHVYRSVWLGKYGTQLSNVQYSRLGNSFKTLHNAYSEMQIAILIYLFFNWQGGSGDDYSANKRLSDAGFPVEWLVKQTDIMVAYIKNALKVDFDNKEDVKRYAVSVLKDIL